MFKARWYPALGWRDKQLRGVITLMIPRMLASFVFAVNFIFIGRIASQLGEGAPSAFNWGLRIMDIPEALIGTALGFVIFPTLAALTELGEVDERRRVFSQAVRFILLATIPAAAGMILLGKPAVDILFADPDEAALVYAVVQVMAFAMVLQAVHEVVARAFYAQKDTIRPLIFSVAGMVVTITVLYTFYFIYDASDSIPLASPLGVGITGLGYLAAFITELSLLTIVLRRQWQDIDGQNILDMIGRTLAATLVMAIPVYLVDAFLATSVFTEGGRVAGAIRAGVGGAVGAGVFIASAILFNIEEVKQLPALLRRRKRKQQEATSAA
jgi:putative peptidoglycan lipid II flippase